MTKSPEEYFQEQDFSTAGSSGSGFSPAEKAFMEKYMGVNERDVLQSIGLDPAGGPQAAAVPDLHAQMSEEEPLDVLLKKESELLMVGFYLGSQELVIPTMAVQEVIRTMEWAKLPAAPPIVAGVINLRGKVTPLIRLREVLDVRVPRQTDDQFIIICRRKGLQLGMLIERVHTMYRVPQKDIDWNIEHHFGASVEYIAGLVKLQERLLGIVHVDKIIASITS